MRIQHAFLPPVLLFLASLPIKLVAASQMMPFETDIVPVLSRSMEYALPPVGTLSSIAAYNLPGLVWLHLPAFHLTANAGLAILLTMLAFNAISTCAVYFAAKSLFDQHTGWIAAALFTFSETSISMSYTAWAQLLLPGYTALLLLFLWRWISRKSGRDLALAGISATLAWMTHFSAVLLFPAMLVFALLARARWQIRWLAAGAVVCLLLLAPWLTFERSRDFADLRAFLSRRTLVSADVLEQASRYKPEAVAAPAAASPTAAPPVSPPAAPPSTPTLIERAWGYVSQLPGQLFTALHINFLSGGITRGIEALVPAVTIGARFLLLIPVAAFFGAIASALWSLFRRCQDVLPLRDHQAGRVLLLTAFTAALLAGFILTRTLTDFTYLTSLHSLQIIIGAFLLRKISRWRRGAAAVLVILFCLVTSGERIARIITHDDSRFSVYNVSLYRHMRAATDFIAQDWQGESALTVSYDVLPETPSFWWVVAWNSIDPAYRAGMSYDFLLAYHHGLINQNQDAAGNAPDPDYVIVYTTGLSRYDLSQYQIHRFGAIVVLKEVE